MGTSLDDDAAALRKILEIVPAFVILVGQDGVIRYINRVEPGYVRSDVVGMQSSVLFFPDSRDRFEAALRAVVSRGEPVELEAEILAPDGTSAWYRSQLFPYREGAVIVGAVIVGTNVTALKAAEASVANLRRLLPLCSWCGRIRSEDGSWERVDEYLHKRADTEVTHGICADCALTQLRS